MPRPANPRVRAALLEAGERLIHERGYNGAGVKEIVDAAGVPKGSFYGYFESKEALLVAVVERYWEDVQARHGALLSDPGRPPRERIAVFFAAMADDHELRNFALGCLLGSMALEMSNVSEDARASLSGTSSARRSSASASSPTWCASSAPRSAPGCRCSTHRTSTRMPSTAAGSTSRRSTG